MNPVTLNEEEYELNSSNMNGIISLQYIKKLTRGHTDLFICV